MFENWNVIQVYLYLELLFGSLMLSLIVKQRGWGIMRVMYEEIKRRIEREMM